MDTICGHREALVPIAGRFPHVMYDSEKWRSSTLKLDQLMKFEYRI